MSERSVDRFYSRWSYLYDLVSRRTPGVGALRQRTVDRLDLTHGDTVIEMGCGPGPNFGPLRTVVGDAGTVVGVELAEGVLARARNHVDSAGWANVHVLRGDATRPPVAAGDAILGTFVIGMFDDPVSVIERWCGIVGPGGRIALLHFAKSERWYASVPNVLLRLLVLASTPGSRHEGGATEVLDHRVRHAHEALEARSDRYVHTTHWGGLIHLAIGRVTQP